IVRQLGIAVLNRGIRRCELLLERLDEDEILPPRIGGIVIDVNFEAGRNQRRIGGGICRVSEIELGTRAAEQSEVERLCIPRASRCNYRRVESLLRVGKDLRGCELRTEV